MNAATCLRLTSALVLLALGLPGHAARTAPDEPLPQARTPSTLVIAGADNEAVGGFIVYYRDDAAPGDETAKAAVNTRKALDRDLARVNAALTVSAKRDRRLATGGHLLSLPKALGKDAAQRFMRALAENPDIASIEPNVRHWPSAVPNDPQYISQWALREATGGLNIEPAWDHSMGSGVTIAVVDTGRTAHPDLDAKTVPGYDFISDAAEARDGNGRDGDPTDAGNWNSENQCGEGAPARDSSWHGTHVAGIAAALTHNGIGIAGAAPGAALQHVRVLGRCGGTTADIAEAIIWASGGHVAGVPDNATPARVINLSLGGSGECGTTYQNAINSARSRRSVVVIAAGNESMPASLARPANCSGVITVAANNRDGEKSDYSNYGLAVDVTAPGGEGSGDGMILSTLNSGSSTAQSPTYGGMNGTSMATPYVAGVVALMLERNPALTPDQVAGILRDTARPFPSYCLGGCGTGIVDAAAAVRRVRGGPFVAFPVSVALYGNGSGRVTSQPARIDCGSRCSDRFDAGTTITLNATPEDGYEFTGWAGACQGSSRSCTLPMNQGRAVYATFKIPVQTMHNGSVRTGLAASDDRKLMFAIDVPAGATDLTFEMSGGSGDADLYVRRDVEPSTDGETYDCRPWKVGNNETCRFEAPVAGRYFAMISADGSYSGVQLRTFYTTNTFGGAALTRGSAVRNLSLPDGGARYYRFTVPQGATNLSIRLQGSAGDADLYVRRGAVPSFDSFDCRPYLSGSTETCSSSTPASGTYYIMLHAESAVAGLTLTADYTSQVPSQRLTIGWAGLGGGSVTLRRAATGEVLTTCGAFPCEVSVPQNISYDLIPSAAFGSSFAEWQGTCDSRPAAGQCRIKLAAPRTLTARFVMSRPNSPSLTIERQGSGNGTVQVKRVATGQTLGTCSQYPCRLGPPDATHELIATPNASSRFAGWTSSQCDSIVNGNCRVRVSRPISITARFSPK